MVCIEKGSTLRFDLDHHVRLVDAGEYAIDGCPFLKGFLSGLHAGNFDISHIFLDNLYKVSHCKDVGGDRRVPRLVRGILQKQRRLVHLHPLRRSGIDA
jgi:hypothetical protein